MSALSDAVHTLQRRNKGSKSTDSNLKEIGQRKHILRTDCSTGISSHHPCSTTPPPPSAAAEFLLPPPPPPPPPHAAEFLLPPPPPPPAPCSRISDTSPHSNGLPPPKPPHAAGFLPTNLSPRPPHLQQNFCYPPPQPPPCSRISANQPLAPPPHPPTCSRIFAIPPPTPPHAAGFLPTNLSPRPPPPTCSRIFAIPPPPPCSRISATQHHCNGLPPAPPNAAGFLPTNLSPPPNPHAAEFLLPPPPLPHTLFPELQNNMEKVPMPPLPQKENSSSYFLTILVIWGCSCAGSEETRLAPGPAPFGCDQRGLQCGNFPPCQFNGGVPFWHPRDCLQAIMLASRPYCMSNPPCHHCFLPWGGVIVPPHHLIAKTDPIRIS